MKFKKPGKPCGHGLGKQVRVLGKARRLGGATEEPAPPGTVHLSNKLKGRARRWAERRELAQAEAAAKKAGKLFDPAKVDLANVEAPLFMAVRSEA